MSSSSESRTIRSSTAKAMHCIGSNALLSLIPRDFPPDEKYNSFRPKTKTSLPLGPEHETPHCPPPGPSSRARATRTPTPPPPSSTTLTPHPAPLQPLHPTHKHRLPDHALVVGVCIGSSRIGSGGRHDPAVGLGAEWRRGRGARGRGGGGRLVGRVDGVEGPERGGVDVCAG